MSFNRRKHRQITYTTRDIEMLYFLYGIRYATTTQLYELFWRDSYDDPQLGLKACQRRLRGLAISEVIRRIRQAVIPGTGSRPDIFKLAAKSIPLLEYECGVDPKTVDVEIWADEELSPSIKHVLATTDVHIAFHRACQGSNFSLDEWIDERALRNSPTKDMISITKPDGAETQVAIIPDVFFILSRDGRRGIYRLEIDRASIELEASREQKRSIAQKIRRYLLLEQSESYRKKYGTRPLQVLWATKGERRKANMIAVTDKVIKHFVRLPEEPAAENQKQEKKLAECKRLYKRFLFTTLDEISQHNPIIDPIWHTVGSEGPRKLIE